MLRHARDQICYGVRGTGSIDQANARPILVSRARVALAVAATVLVCLGSPLTTGVAGATVTIGATNVRAVPTAFSSPVRAGHKPKPPATVVLRPRFHIVARQVVNVISDGRYVVTSTVGGGTRLIDEQTGKQTTLVLPPSCVDQPPWVYRIGPRFTVGGGWLLTSCVRKYQLYSIASGTWMPSSLDEEPVAVGSQWVESYGMEPSAIAWGCLEHCSYRYSFANIATGEVRTLDSWRPGGTTAPELNSAGLAAPLCSLLRVPHGLPPQGELPDVPRDPGPLTFAGPFAVGLDWKFDGPYPIQVSLLLERCGTRLPRVLTSQTWSWGPPMGETEPQFAINRHAVVWLKSQAGPLRGAFLPSLRQFRIPLGRVAPPPPQGGYQPPSRSIFLTSRTLYVWNHDVGSDLLAATAPQPK
ncbi:MAG: hypothetical protein NVS4B2_23300 [Chloroflexota bacterium]